ncbi:hypothetical protein NEIMUCOT_04068 [Neisseria mucosa ATCC 25996]|uniref:Uncharacterized protein n=1 Tax=Neisseria mucosa (strain ATCC 25996 / DSM 4631 / NCTC 10774 / M26) TaxID=546266 RepID=D2ZTY0_NEIM2|nr:hypothetical protein NEIMUCOT_04068 [Neisseria mucosa ATCC 25996]
MTLYTSKGRLKPQFVFSDDLNLSLSFYSSPAFAFRVHFLHLKK